MGMEAPAVAPEEKIQVAEAYDRGWNVIVWNDPVNLMVYVVYVFQKVLGFNKELARKHMLEVHEEGRSCVIQENRERAELYLHQLLEFGLKTTIEKAE